MSSAGFRISWFRSSRVARRAFALVAGAAALGASLAIEQSPAAAATRSQPLQIGASINIRCTIITVPVQFGNYVITQSAPLDFAGAISLNCTPSNFQIRIRLDQGLYPGPGSNNPNPVRRMSDGLGNFLNYNLYRNAARTQVWGGTNPTGVQPPNGPWPMLIPVYGRIPALQSVQPGEYADTVEVMVLF